MRRTIIEFLIIVVILAGLIFASPLYMPSLLSRILSTRLGAEVNVTHACLNIKEGIKASDIYIENERGLACAIGEAVLCFNRTSFLTLIRERTLFIQFRLKGIRFKNPGKTVIGSVTDALGFSKLDLLALDNTKGDIYLKNNEVVLKGIEGKGEYISVSIDGTIAKNNLINCTFKSLLSNKLIETMPEERRKFFFKMDESWSRVELYISGEIDHPGINFSTALFKLTVR